MSFYHDDYYRPYYPPAASSAELKEMANNSIKRLEKKGQILHPIKLTSKTISKSWWGKAWCDNINWYADLANRINRARKYVRADCVIDLQITKGKITAKVQGSSKKSVYNVTIKINTMSVDKFNKILESCSFRADSLESLVKGDFPDELKNSLTMRKDGLFPVPSEIYFSCSCPDSAYMCKHVGAAILAVGSLLDDNPLLLFTLRGVDTDALIKRSVEEKLNMMLDNSSHVSSDRIMDVSEEEITELFGVL